jgi:hypothetical protein
MVGSVALSRLTFDRLGPVALVSVVAALPLSLWVFWESRVRYQAGASTGVRLGSRGGRSPAAIALATVVLAVIALAALWVPS